MLSQLSEPKRAHPKRHAAEKLKTRKRAIVQIVGGLIFFTIFSC